MRDFSSQGVTSEEQRENYADLRDMFKNGIISEEQREENYADLRDMLKNGIISEELREENYADLRDMFKNGIISEEQREENYADSKYMFKNGIISEEQREENYADLRDMLKNGIISEELREENYADLRDMLKNGIIFFFQTLPGGPLRASVKARVSASSKTPQLLYTIKACLRSLPPYSPDPLADLHVVLATAVLSGRRVDQFNRLIPLKKQPAKSQVVRSMKSLFPSSFAVT